ncbi:Xyloglucan:xyloglucosyl transferase protein [Dioscorea alata]|uniref:Xyloglucan:xyloglucosyl transferase protein n=1 Tax=Dioscorea alata TaxID=55571 RepID=A0ACB7UQP8_DIOAL|nr:Xyloglucan:xyloglucosyl transferase protein [Dioscorea alata]
MAFLLLPFILLMFPYSTEPQPSPDYYPSSKFSYLSFNQAYNTLWGPQNQALSQDHSTLSIWLNKNSGSGFKSISSYRNGYFAASIKVQSGYTAGVNTAFYLSNGQAYPGYHDEIDIELLGTTAGKPYTLQTNVFVRGSGDGGRIVGREVRFHLWFDPTADFHSYAILWNPDEIIFFVDDMPIRRYPKKSEPTFPQREMWVYGSIWDASSWATEGGKYKVNYDYQPFMSKLTKFIIGVPASASPSGFGLSSKQYEAMQWVQSNYMIYDYCKDYSRDHSLTPECFI